MLSEGVHITPDTADPTAGYVSFLVLLSQPFSRGSTVRTQILPMLPNDDLVHYSTSRRPTSPFIPPSTPDISRHVLPVRRDPVDSLELYVDWFWFVFPGIA